MNDLDTDALQRPGKRFKTAQANLAILGWQLVRSHPEDDDFFIALKWGSPTLAFRKLEQAVQHLCGDTRCLASIDN